MKTSLRRLRGALHKHESKGRRDVRALIPKDELAQASQDVQDMRDCYDSLLSAAAATANSAFEFSESLRELGACLLERTALNEDEESGRVLLMLGKLQFELQNLVDKYRSHVFQTITIPSESLLNELRIVEEMKRHCDEKRNVYEGMLARQREKGRSKGGKGESFSTQQLLEAHDEYDNETTLFVFRLKSLKQGQTRSLLTQAARHHAAQLCFFKKALKSLEEVEPHVQMLSESQHIDYHFSGLEDDENNEDDGSEVHDDGDLSSEDRVNVKEHVVDSSAEENEKGKYGRFHSFGRGSQSAPLFVETRTSPPSEKLLRMRSSVTRKLNTYVLPTPVETRRNPNSTTAAKIWLDTPKVLRESNKKTSSRLPPPLADGLLYSHLGTLKRRSFSGPLTSKPLPLSSTPRLYSGPIPRNSVSKLPRKSPLSPSASPTFVSTPKISELHELPRPPPSISLAKSQLPLLSNAASPLPMPPSITRSFSIPSTSKLRGTELDMSKTASPPLTPVSLIHPPSTLPDLATHQPISKQERT